MVLRTAPVCPGAQLAESRLVRYSLYPTSSDCARIRYASAAIVRVHAAPEGGLMFVKPEEVGLSAPRLERISAHLQRYIDAGKVAGTLTLVARQGQIAYCEPQGHL